MKNVIGLSKITIPVHQYVWYWKYEMVWCILRSIDSTLRQRAPLPTHTKKEWRLIASWDLYIAIFLVQINLRSPAHWGTPVWLCVCPHPAIWKSVFALGRYGLVALGRYWATNWKFTVTSMPTSISSSPPDGLVAPKYCLFVSSSLSQKMG